MKRLEDSFRAKHQQTYFLEQSTGRTARDSAKMSELPLSKRARLTEEMSAQPPAAAASSPLLKSRHSYAQPAQPTFADVAYILGQSKVLQVLQLAFAQGLQDKAIAEQMQVQPGTVRHYWRKLYDVLGIDPDIEREAKRNLRTLVEMRARERGLID